MIREEADKIRQIPVVFILGKGRSGTTLLQSLLNTHPNIIAPPESKLIVMNEAHYGKLKKWTTADVHSFVSDLYREPFFALTWKQDRAQLEKNLLSALEWLDYPLACKIVYSQMRGNKSDIILIADKNPFYAIFIPELKKVFPEAKFIHLVRDPRDNVLSTLNAYGGSNVIFVALQWLIHNRIIEEDKRSRPEKYLTILYEDMVKDIAGTMKKICNFLSVPYNEAMKDINRQELKDTYSTDPAMFEKNKSSMMEPINTTNIGKWKTGLKPEDIAIIEHITGKYANNKYGYTLTGKNMAVPPFEIFKWRIIYKVWLPFTRLRYKNKMVNRIYSNWKEKNRPDTMPPWEKIIDN